MLHEIYLVPKVLYLADVKWQEDKNSSKQIFRSPQMGLKNFNPKSEPYVSLRVPRPPLCCEAFIPNLAGSTTYRQGPEIRVLVHHHHHHHHDLLMNSDSLLGICDCRFLSMRIGGGICAI